MLKRQEGKAHGLHTAKDRNEDNKTQVAHRRFVMSATKGRKKQSNIKQSCGNSGGIISKGLRVFFSAVPIEEI